MDHPRDTSLPPADAAEQECSEGAGGATSVRHIEVTVEREIRTVIVRRWRAFSETNTAPPLPPRADRPEPTSE